jgi:ABC-type sugar transport system ATPase subunit
MDEPTRGIDVNAKAEIYRIMKQLAQEGTCIIFISSEVPEIVEVSDRILILTKGAITAEFKAGVSQNEILQNILMGSE